MSNISYDLDTSGGLMPLIRALVKPPDEELTSHKPKKSQHPYYKRPGKGHNHDCCDACNEGGDLICCDRCPASFHLGCYDPPLDESDIPAGLWLCKACRGADAEKSTSSRSSRAQSPVDCSDTDKKTRLHKKKSKEDKDEKEKRKDGDGEKDPNPMEVLVKAAKIMNPKQFELPREMQIPCMFPGTEKVGTKNGGATVITKEGSLAALPIKSCHVCAAGCRTAPLLLCDYCPLLFHQDCLDPPLTALPTGRWMCPNHVEQYIDSMLVKSVSATERAALWEKFSGPVDQHAIKMDFIRRARCNRPFRVKVPAGAARERVEVPPMVRAHYGVPPPLMPSRREYSRAANVLRDLKASGAYDESDEESDMTDETKHKICLNLSCPQYNGGGPCPLDTKSAGEDEDDDDDDDDEASGDDDSEQEVGADVDYEEASVDDDDEGSDADGDEQEEVEDDVDEHQDMGGNDNEYEQVAVGNDTEGEDCLGEGDVDDDHRIRTVEESDGQRIVEDAVIQNDAEMGASDEPGPGVDTVKLGMDVDNEEGVIAIGIDTKAHTPMEDDRIMETAAPGSGSAPAVRSIQRCHPRKRKLGSEKGTGDVKKPFRIRLRDTETTRRIVAMAEEDLKGLDERYIKIMAYLAMVEVAGNEEGQARRRWGGGGAWAARARERIGASERAALLRLGLRLLPLPSALLRPADRRRIAEMVWGGPQPPPSPPAHAAPRLHDDVVCAALCPVTMPLDGNGEATLGAPLPMCTDTFHVGTSASSDLRLRTTCRRVSDHHATIFYDQVSLSYELLNYSEWGTSVNGTMYAMDTSANGSFAADSAAAVRYRRDDSDKEREHYSECRCALRPRDTRGAWEGGAVVTHGALLQFGCQLYVFSILDDPV